MSERFFQGTPCAKCLRTQRYASDGKCVYCVRARDRARYSKRRPQQKAYYEANRERICASTREHSRKKHARDPRYKMLASAKQRAVLYGRECTLTLDDIVIPERCPLLGLKITTGSRQQKSSSPSLDRKSSSKGYVPGNIWVVSWRANRVKSDSTLEELKLIVKNWPPPS
jgi:hypothetical protein